MKKNKNKLLVLTAMLTMLLGISLSSNSVTYANFEGFKNNCLTDIQDSDSKNDTGKTHLKRIVEVMVHGMKKEQRLTK
ncbi:hypothetical protein [Enterococcus faecalis]|uniref:hypothetical protein n=1 Tax=Enterococcus faecalis TaxID=1351 RepID=UPI002AF6C8CC|nr:hypothetical protein [Enterococcus faecalis]WQP96328.1 hypothetical protein U8P19_15195 [Enterococcus faecalis]